MPTTTAQVIISSTDLLSAALTVSNTKTLKQSSAADIAESTGLAARKKGDTNIYTIHAAADYGNNGAAKVYIKNNDATFANFVTITIGSQTLGRLYGGDWLFMPTLAPDGSDLKVTPSTTDSVTLEYMALY